MISPYGVNPIADAFRVFGAWLAAVVVLACLLACASCAEPPETVDDDRICLEDYHGNSACFAPCDVRCRTECVTFEIGGDGDPYLIDLCVPDE